MKFHKLARKIDKLLVKASYQAFLQLAAVAKATGSLAMMKDLFNNASSISSADEVYEGAGAGTAKGLIDSLNAAARQLYMKAFNQGVSREEVAGASSKMLGLVDSLDAAAKNTKTEKGPMDPSFWGKLNAVKAEIAKIIPVDIASQNPATKERIGTTVVETVDPTENSKAAPPGSPVDLHPQQSYSDPYYQKNNEKLSPQLSDVVDDLMNPPQHRDLSAHWEDFLKE